MQRKRIILEDGRYLIFYTFGEEAAAASSNSAEATTTAGAEESSTRRAEPQAEPQATEEPQRV